MLEPLKTIYINPDEIIERFKREHPKYTNKQLIVRVYEQSYEIRHEKKLLDLVQVANGCVFKTKGRTYGYCRVSTMKQSIERQIRNVKAEYPDALIVTDEYTGTRLDRPGWTKLYKQLKPGDTVVFDQVSRMSRDAEEGFRVYEELFNLGVNLIFLKEPHINTSVYHEVAQAPETGDKDLDETLIRGLNEYLMRLAKKQIQLAFDQAEKEVEDLHQRTREGIETARLNGKQIGQKKGAKLTTKKSIAAKEIIRKRSKDFEGNLPDVDVIKLIGCNRGSYYKYKREMKEAEA